MVRIGVSGAVIEEDADGPDRSKAWESMRS